MPKAKNPSPFVDLKPRASETVIAATDDLAIIKVTVASQKGYINSEGYYTHNVSRATLSDLIVLQNYITRGWKIVATTQFDGLHHNSVLYTLYKPCDPQ